MRWAPQSTMENCTPQPRHTSVLLALALLLAVPACDALVDDGETIILQPKEVTFRFEFSGEDLTSGEAFSVNSVTAADLEDALRRDGYGKDEVVGARLNRAQLRRVNPISLQLSSLSDFSLQLVSGNAQASVASLDNPSGTAATLELGPTRSVTNFVRQPSFSAIARFTPAGLPDGDYVLTVTLEIQIEVESL